MPKFTITTLETHRVTYQVEANSKAEAIQIWERMTIKQAERVTNDDTVGRRINGEEF